MSLAEPDSFSIPTGARHPDEAFKFLLYLNRQEVVEKLALGHRKMTSLRAVSPSFLENHPHPYIEAFIDIAASPNVARKPPIAQRNQLEAEMRNTIGLILRQKADSDRRSGRNSRRSRPVSTSGIATAGTASRRPVRKDGPSHDRARTIPH